MIDNEKLDPEFKRAWLKALRSGEYLQGSKALKRSDHDVDSYCCLGVACEVLNVHWQEAESVEYVSGRSTMYAAIIDDDEYRPGTLNLPFIDVEDARTLADMNDYKGATFLDIANYIEANL